MTNDEEWSGQCLAFSGSALLWLRSNLIDSNIVHRVLSLWRIFICPTAYRLQNCKKIGANHAIKLCTDGSAPNYLNNNKMIGSIREKEQSSLKSLVSLRWSSSLALSRTISANIAKGWLRGSTRETKILQRITMWFDYLLIIISFCVLSMHCRTLGYDRRPAGTSCRYTQSETNISGQCQKMLRLTVWKSAI